MYFKVYYHVEMLMIYRQHSSIIYIQLLAMRLN